VSFSVCARPRNSIMWIIGLVSVAIIDLLSLHGLTRDSIMKKQMVGQVVLKKQMEKFTM
jgi:hypothetical protein